MLYVYNLNKNYSKIIRIFHKRSFNRMFKYNKKKWE